MVTFEEAYKKAKEYKGNIDCYTEYENGFTFASTEDVGYIGGAGHTPVIVLKPSGEVTNMPMFVATGTGKELKSYILEDGVFVEDPNADGEEEDDE